MSLDKVTFHFNEVIIELIPDAFSETDDKELGKLLEGKIVKVGEKVPKELYDVGDTVLVRRDIARDLKHRVFGKMHRLVNNYENLQCKFIE